MDARTEAKNRNACNKELGAICRNLYSGIPVDVIARVLNSHEFNGNAMDGIYCGRDGRMNEQVGQRTWITVMWHKYEDTGRFEVVVYVHEDVKRMADVKYPGVRVKLVGEDGNAFAILGAVSKALRQANVPKSEIDAFFSEATAGDYNHLLATVMKTVEVGGADPSDDDDDNYHDFGDDGDDGDE